MTSLSKKGLKPPISSHMSTPKDHTSHSKLYPRPTLSPLRLPCLITSGARQLGVPHFVKVRYLGELSSFEVPKSTSFRFAVLYDKTRLSTLRSL